MTTTLNDLTDGVYADLADEAKEVFSTKQVQNFIRGGMADLNRASPTDTSELITLVTDPDTGLVTQFAYATVISQPYRVEVVRFEDGWVQNLNEPVDGWVGSGGFNFYSTPDGGRIEFPIWWLSTFPVASYGIRIHGYAARPMPDPADGATDLPLSTEEEYSVRAYARSAGYDMLAHDRSLFAQWQGQTNNSDVSPTQMMQMASSAKQEWDRHRGLIRTVRKYW